MYALTTPFSINLSVSHQPRQAIWGAFDTVLILAKGYQLFHGRPCDAERWFTAELGFCLPQHTSPADFIMDQANIDFNKTKYYQDLKSLRTQEDLEKVNE